jgi:hypothetical protein
VRTAVQVRFGTGVMLVSTLVAFGFAAANALTEHSGFQRPNAVLSAYLALVVWCSFLSKVNAWQVKVACVNTVAVWISDEIIVATNGGHTDRSFGDWAYAMLVVFVIPTVFYLNMKGLAVAIHKQNQSKEEILVLSSSLSAKLLNSAPILFFLLLGCIQSLIARKRIKLLICSLFTNSTSMSYAGNSGRAAGEFAWWDPEKKPFGKIIATGGWENCDPSALHAPLVPVTAHDVALRDVLLQFNDNEIIFYSKYLQSLELSLLFATVILMTAIRHKKLNDVFSMNVTEWEMALIVATALRLITETYVSTLSGRRQCLSIDELAARRSYGMTCFVLSLPVTFIICARLLLQAIRSHEEVKKEVKKIQQALSLEPTTTAATAARRRGTFVKPKETKRDSRLTGRDGDKDKSKKDVLWTGTGSWL